MIDHINSPFIIQLFQKQENENQDVYTPFYAANNFFLLNIQIYKYRKLVHNLQVLKIHLVLF